MLGYNEKEDRYEFLFHKDEKDQLEKVTQEVLRKSLSAYVYRQRKPVLLKKRDIELLYLKEEAELVGNPAEIWLGVPLITGRGVLGVMVVQNYYNEDAYDEHDLKTLFTIASQVAIAIDNYYLLQDLRKQVFQINALYESLQQMSEESPTISMLLEKIIKDAVELYNADAGQLFFYDEITEISKVMFTYNMELLKDMEFGPGEGMINQLLKTGKGLYTNDYFKEDYASPKLNLPGFREKIKGVVEVPLKWKGKIIGILAMSSRPGDQRIFSREDVSQLENFAGSAAIAVSIARIISFQQTLFHK
jgi:GAF domain-containing protein